MSVQVQEIQKSSIVKVRFDVAVDKTRYKQWKQQTGKIKEHVPRFSDFFNLGSVSESRRTEKDGRMDRFFFPYVAMTTFGWYNVEIV